MTKPGDHLARLGRAQRSLAGLSVGDAFGERFFLRPDIALHRIEARELPDGQWGYTDDTVMAIAITETLAEHGHIDGDTLARRFAAKHQREPMRGYGAKAHQILSAIAAGSSWQHASTSVYDGTGSMGNGGAMRASPIGGYFSDDLQLTADNACKSALVTHAHPEGQAGAIAVAVAAGFAANADASTTPARFFAAVLYYTPPSETRDGIARASAVPSSDGVTAAVAALGNGSRVIAPDTVPFTMWCAARHLHDYEQAMWTTVSGLGDRDTTCAIVGGIVALSPLATVPASWLAARESLDVMAEP